ncbi:MAG TPA: pyridoxal-phosphate dependent enzyme [Candidatus Acidoferrum sp.]|nr:pyridoxal-phosphate dependent enzyme [Candidatus Acidoferrum sp.]
MPVPITRIEADWLHQGKVAMAMLRADLVDAELSGNKYYKLLPNLQLAREQGQRTLLSFGGPWSNHLHALAAAGHRFGFATIGIVRGDQGGPLTVCLHDAREWGMQLQFVSRGDYDRRHDPAWWAELQQQFGPHYLIPEGGANRAGIVGCQQLIADRHDYTHIMLACGTGATLTGIASVSRVPVIGIQVLKGAGYLQQQVASLLVQHGLAAACDWRVLDAWHHGGYGRVTPALLDFMYKAEADTGIPLEPVYAAKLLWAARALIGEDYFPPGARLLLVHGGGLQGRRSLG